MMGAPIKDATCQLRLVKWIESKYSEEVQECIEYFTDVITSETYSFKFHVPATGEKILLTIDRITKNIIKSYW